MVVKYGWWLYTNYVVYLKTCNDQVDMLWILNLQFDTIVDNHIYSSSKWLSEWLYNASFRWIDYHDMYIHKIVWSWLCAIFWYIYKCVVVIIVHTFAYMYGNFVYEGRGRRNPIGAEDVVMKNKWWKEPEGSGRSQKRCDEK